MRVVPQRLGGAKQHGDEECGTAGGNRRQPNTERETQAAVEERHLKQLRYAAPEDGGLMDAENRRHDECPSDADGEKEPEKREDSAPAAKQVKTTIDWPRQDV